MKKVPLRLIADAGVLRGSGALRELQSQIWVPENAGGWPVEVTLNEVPQGRTPVETYAVTPNPERARFLVPLRSRRAAAAAASSFNGLRLPRTRVSRSALGVGLRTGIGGPLLRHRLTVSMDPGVPRSDYPEYLLSAFLDDVLGVATVAGISVREPDPNMKPIMQVFDARDGRAAAFVKVGWNAATRDLVAGEAGTMETVRSAIPVKVPRLIHHGQWQGREVAVTAPLPARIRKHPDPDRPLPARIPLAIAESTGTFTARLADSLYWRHLCAAAGHADPEVSHAITAAAARVERAHGNTELRFGRWHGDWAPWNLGWDGQDLWVWDWEHSAPAVPVGFDLLHWRFQVAVAYRDLPLERAVADVRLAAERELGEVGVVAESRTLLAELYLLEMFMRTCRLRRGGGGWHPRIFPAVMLETLAELEAGL